MAEEHQNGTHGDLNDEEEPASPNQKNPMHEHHEPLSPKSSWLSRRATREDSDSEQSILSSWREGIMNVFVEEEQPEEPTKNEQLIASSSEYLQTRKKINFYALVLAWLGTLSIVGAILFYILEPGTSVEDSLFMSMNAVTATGLATVDVGTLKTKTKILLVVIIQGGSSIMISLIPAIIRMHYLRRQTPRDLWHFDLDKFEIIPQWLVEYKSLQFLCRFVMAYQLFWYSVGWVGLFWCAKLSPDLNKDASSTSLGWSLFHTVSAFTNTGFSLQPSFASTDSPIALVLLSSLVLAGNTFFPIILRWAIIFANKLAPRDSNRKIYYRYLLLNNRLLYTNLFSSQQNWLLVFIQIVFLSFQSIMLRVFGTHVNNIKTAFVSICTRHAGFSAIDLDDQNAGILALFIAMMFLAPTPYMIVLHRFTPTTQTRTRLDSSPFLAPSPNPSESESVAFSDDNTEQSSDGWPTPAERETVQSSHVDRPSIKEEQRRSEYSKSRTLTLKLHQGMELRESRVDARQSNISSSGGDDSTCVGASETSEVATDAEIDTRLLLLQRYGETRVPWRIRILTRLSAFRFSVRSLMKHVATESTAREIAFLWFAWYLILLIQNYTPDNDTCSSNIFKTMFEICSAYGNVGLSLGADNPNRDWASFSYDLHVVSKLILIVVMVTGRTRDFPLRVDGALVLTKPDDLHSDAFLRQSPEGASQDETQEEPEVPKEGYSPRKKEQQRSTSNEEHKSPPQKPNGTSSSDSSLFAIQETTNAL